MNKLTESMAAAIADGTFRKIDSDKIENFIDLSGALPHCIDLYLTSTAIRAIRTKRLVVTTFIYDNEHIGNVTLFIGAKSGYIELSGDGHNTQVFMGEGTSGNFKFNLFGNTSLHIDESSTANGVFIQGQDSTITIGKDCMIADGVTIQGADMHGIVDLSTGVIENSKAPSIVIGDHVWLASGSRILADTSIGDGTIIAAGSIVRTTMPAHCVCAGVPAKVIKSNRTWTRSMYMLDEYCSQAVEDFKS